MSQVHGSLHPSAHPAAGHVPAPPPSGSAYPSARFRVTPKGNSGHTTLLPGALPSPTAHAADGPGPTQARFAGPIPPPAPAAGGPPAAAVHSANSASVPELPLIAAAVRSSAATTPNMAYAPNLTVSPAAAAAGRGFEAQTPSGAVAGAGSATGSGAGETPTHAPIVLPAITPGGAHGHASPGIFSSGSGVHESVGTGTGAGTTTVLSPAPSGPRRATLAASLLSAGSGSNAAAIAGAPLASVAAPAAAPSFTASAAALHYYQQHGAASPNAAAGPTAASATGAGAGAGSDAAPSSSGGDSRRSTGKPGVAAAYLLQQQQLKQQQQQQQTLPASMAAAVAATNTNASAQSHVAPAQAHAEPPTLVPAPNSHRHASSTVPAAAMTAAVAQHTQQQHHAASAAPVPAPAPAPAAAPAGVLAQTSGAAAGAADPDAAAAAAAAASRPLVPGAVRPHMTPAEALRVHGARLTSFEQSEILEYGHVWFTGPNARKIRGIPHTANNNGYDDERGDYKFVLGDHIEYRYEVLAMYGKGSFGQVARVYDYKKDSIVALKIIRNKKRFHHQALVEIRILEHLMNRDREHKSNIVRVYGYFYFRNHLCITFEPLSLNLYEYIKANNFRGMSLSLVRRMAHQLLQTLSFLIKENTIHCDLKPENILLKSTSKSNIRVIDFGSSCFANECVYTYIQSRFYRSPEVILGCSYGLPIDMWSLGCILVELHTGYPIFPGEDETEQIQCIMEIFGLPPQRMLATATRRKAFFDDAGRPKVVPNSRGKVRHVASKDLAEAARTTDARFLSFIRECLQWDPAQRLTPDQGLLHPFITERESLAATTPGAGASAAVTPGVAVATPAIPAVAGSAYGSSASTTGSSSTAARSTLPGGGNSSIVSVANSQSQFSAASSQRAPSPSGFVGSEATVAGAPTPKGSVGVYAGSSGFHAAAASAADGAARHA